MAKVVGIRGVATPDENGADPNVVSLLEELLRDACSGALKGVALSVVYGNGDIDTRSAAGPGYRHFLVAGTVYLQVDLAAEARSTSDGEAS